MKKKHYICTNTWSNPDTIKDIVKQQGEMTDAEFFAGLKTEKAETLQHWMGKDDFFSVICKLRMNKLLKMFWKRVG